MNYECNLLHHVGVVAKRVCAAVETAAQTAAHTEGDGGAHRGGRQYPFGPNGPRGKNKQVHWLCRSVEQRYFASFAAAVR